MSAVDTPHPSIVPIMHEHEVLSGHGWQCCVLFEELVPLLPSICASYFLNYNLIIFKVLGTLGMLGSSFVIHK